MGLALYLSMRPSIHHPIFVYASICLSIYMFVSLFRDLSISFSLCLSFQLSCGLFIYLAVYLLMQLSILSIYVPKRFTHPSMWFFIFPSKQFDSKQLTCAPKTNSANRHEFQWWCNFQNLQMWDIPLAPSLSCTKLDIFSLAFADATSTVRDFVPSENKYEKWQANIRNWHLQVAHSVTSEKTDRARYKHDKTVGRICLACRQTLQRSQSKAIGFTRCALLHVLLHVLAHFWQGAESLAPATQNHIWTFKGGPNMMCFVHFDLEMCFAPQRRALFRHVNFQKWSQDGVLCTVWLPNVLRATTACTFSTRSTSKSCPKWCAWAFWLGNVLRATPACTFSTMSTSKSGPKWCYCANVPHRRAIFHLSSGHMALHPPL